MFENVIEFNVIDFVFSLITFLVLFLILKHFLFEKVHDFMENRSREIQDTMDNAAETNRLADEKLRTYNEQIANVEMESREIIKKSRDEAKTQADLIIEEANEQARVTIERSLQEVEREKLNARKALAKEFGDIAAMAAGKILEKEIKAEDHEEIIDKIIEEAEEKPWN